MADPGPLDELLVELAGGDERTVHRNELTARLDVIEGDRCTREVYLAGGRLKQSESLAVTAHSPDGFGWGDDDLGAAQLALAVLLRAADRDTALAQYEAFTREVIATLPQGDFSLRLACVHEWLVARTDS